MHNCGSKTAGGPLLLQVAVHVVFIKSFEATAQIIGMSRGHCFEDPEVEKHRCYSAFVSFRPASVAMFLIQKGFLEFDLHVQVTHGRLANFKKVWRLKCFLSASGMCDTGALLQVPMAYPNGRVWL